MRPHSQRGQDLAEAALILPLLVLLILGIIQFGIIVMQYNSVANAARMGAREGIVNPPSPIDDSGTCADGGPALLTAACSLTTGLVQGNVEVAWSDDDCDSSTGIGCIQVTVSYPAELIIGPLFGATEPTIALSATSTMEREQ